MMLDHRAKTSNLPLFEKGSYGEHQYRSHEINAGLCQRKRSCSFAESERIKIEKGL